MHVLGRGLRASGASVVVVGERSERRGGAAGRPRIVAEGDVLRVLNILGPRRKYICWL